MDQTTNYSDFPVPEKGYRAVCFDLDGTLLPMELDEFLRTYYKKLGEFMVRRGLDGATFKKALNAGVKAMIENDSDSVNADDFFETYFACVEECAAEGRSSGNAMPLTLSELSHQETRDLFEAFYETTFPSIGENVVPSPDMVRAVNTLKQKGYPIALLTMPLFPQIALKYRCEWAGVHLEDFERVTHYENSTSVKPKLRYYEENLVALGLEGSDVLMVGNNTVEDLAFDKLGADTYLVTDTLLDPVGFDLATTRHGSYADFAAWVDALPPCENPADQIHNGPVDPALLGGR